MHLLNRRVVAHLRNVAARRWAGQRIQQPYGGAAQRRYDLRAVRLYERIVCPQQQVGIEVVRVRRGGRHSAGVCYRGGVLCGEGGDEETCGRN